MKSYSVFLICLVFQTAAPGIISSAANLPDLKTVGEPHILGEPHIVGGDEVEPHSHPYQIGLQLNPNDIDAGFCGGSLLSDIWILTAAHCTDFPLIKEAKITAGAHLIRERESVTQTLWIDKVILHPKYNKWMIKDDIALVRLATPAKFNKYIQPIRLPSQKQKNAWFLHEKVTITGWGADRDGSLVVSSALRGAETKTISNFFCSLSYFFLRVWSTNICASGWRWKGSCYGDSGGPMIIKESDGIRTLIGVSSFGSGFGCEKLWPTVFTRVTSYLDWIHSTTGIPKRT